MNRIIFALLALSTAFGGAAAPAEAEDIMSILARKAEIPSRPIPTMIPYSYTLTLDITSIDGKDTSQGQAVLRIDPSQPAGSRAQVIEASDPEGEILLDFLKEVEDPESTMEEKADSFWCGTLDKDDDFDPANFEVVSETPTEAILKPREGKLAELLMQTDEAPEGKSERKMKEKLMERIDGQVILSKPAADIKSFKVTMTRSLTMMVVAKLKVMDVEQNCALAPNGFYHMSDMKLQVEGKAMGKRFGQQMSFQVTDLTPLP